jgi:hypothetical protein
MKLTCGVRLSVQNKKKKKTGRGGVIWVGCCGVRVGWPWAGLVSLPAMFFFLLSFSSFLIS